MTYTTDVEGKRFHSVGYYVRFEGIPTRVSTDNPDDWDNWNPSETMLPIIVRDSLAGGKSSLSKAHGFVEQGAVSFVCAAAGDTEAAADDLFRKRLRASDSEDTLNGAVSASATTFALSDNALPTSGTIYIDRETCTITGNSGSNRTVTRGAEDSIAVPHADGARIATVPIHWYTRRAFLVAVNLETGTERTVWAGTLADAPDFSDGAYAFELVGIMNEWMKRPLCTGWRAVEVSIARVNSSGLLVFNIPDAREFVADGFIRVDVGDRSAIYGQPGTSGVIAVDTASTPNSVTIDPRYFRKGDLQVEEVANQPATIQQVDCVFGSLADIAKTVILSDTGDGSNGTYDALPGQAADTSGASSLFVRRRMGAGIPSAFVDQASINQISSDKRVSIWLDEPMTLGDFITRELAPRVGGYFTVTDAGVLTFIPYHPEGIRSVAPSKTVSGVLESNIATKDAERSRLSRAEIECNYDPISRRYLRKVDIIFNEDTAIYGDRSRFVSYRSKGVWIGQLPPRGDLISEPIDPTALEVESDRQRQREIEAGRVAAYRLPWSEHIDAVEGYRFKMTDAAVPAGDGTRGITDRVYEVTGREPDFESGLVAVDCEEVPRGWVLGFSGIVVSYNAGTKDIALDDSDLADEANAGTDAAAGWEGYVYHEATAYSTREAVVFSIAAADRVRLLGTPLTAPSALDVLVVKQSLDQGAQNAAGCDVEDFAFGADSNYQVGSTNEDGPKWG